jgi:hypothetical protein
MAIRNRTFVITVVTIVLLAVGITTYLFLYQPAVQPHSLLLYTSRQSPGTITNWIVDTDTGEKWEVGKGLAAWHWSPSGRYLVFHTLSPLPRQIWISNNDGSNLRLVLDSKDYPDLEIKDFDWLTDKEIIVNVVSKAENSGFVYLLNVDTRSFKRLNVGNFMRVSPNGKFWIQWAEQHYELVDLNGRLLSLDSNLSEYYLSPNGDWVAYACSGDGKYSSICTAQISINGITNEIKFADLSTTLYAFGEIKWSPDGNNLGFLCSPNKTETRFCAIDGKDGAVIYNLEYPSKTTRFIWSPHGDKVIDWDGLLLDLKTGQVSNFFTEIGETVPSYIVDWRMIEVP